MYRLSILSLLLFSTLLSDTSASLTLLITGRSGVNVDKHQLASQFVRSYDEIIKESPSQLSIFTNGITVPVAVEERHLHGIWDDIHLVGNVTTVIVTNLGIDEMNSDHLVIMQRLSKTISPLIVVEFGGNGSLETRALLDETAICLLGGRVGNASPNVVYFCNGAYPEMLPNLQIDNLHDITPSELNKKSSTPQEAAFWPRFFVSAAKEHRHHDHRHEHHEHHGAHHHGHYHHHHHRHHFDEDVDEIVDQIMEEIAEEVPVISEPAKEAKEYDKKLRCKFRKSCYETGIKPELETVVTRFVKKWFPHWIEDEDAAKKEEVEEEEMQKPYDVEEDLVPQKLRCRYRISCYQERGIPFDEQAEERRKVLLSSKRVIQEKGQKKTLKEIAADTLKMVQEAGEKAAKRPVVKVVEKRLNAIEEKLNEKLNCKYRKSCYETGQKPVVADAWSLPLPIKIFSTEPAEAATKEINYNELEELEKKVYCKYRKSCYETGIKPDIDPEIFVRTFRDLFTIHEQVEPRKMTIQEKCKYRKSCYETGIVPEINPKLEEVIHKEVSAVIPTTAQDLRILCKYRKSCYAEIHDSATVDTVKFIRKRRQIEKEVRRRRAKRAKLHRRFRGELQLDSYRRHHGRNRSREYEHPKKPEEPEKRDEPEDVEEVIDVKIIPPKRGRKEKVKEKQEEVTETPPSKTSKRKPKQLQQKADSEEEVVDEPVSMPTTEVEKDVIPPAKKPRKGKKAKAEEPKKEKKIVKKEEKEEEEEQKETQAEEERARLKLIKKKDVEPEPKESFAKSKEKKEEKKKEKEKQKQEDEDQVKYARQSGSKQFDKVSAGVKKMIEDMHIQQDIQEKKEYCKYRKSCYKSGKQPKIDHSFQHLPEKLSEQIDQEMEKPVAAPPAISKSEAGKKLECKYRKSCYETGVLPEIVVPQYIYNDQEIVFKAGVSKQLQCKYRKSCYAETGIIPEEEDLKDAEEKREPAVKKVAGEQAKKVSFSEDDSDDKDGTKKSIRSAQAATGPAARLADKQTQDVECKSGGKSCYSSAEPQTMNEDHAGSMARIGLERYRQNGWCNKYYYSCREVLGLPPKERAPIGPNGKRLCRKKPL